MAANDRNAPPVEAAPEPVTVVRPDDHDTLPDVLGRLRAAAGERIRLDIPAESPLLLTATEFRALRATADRLDKPLAVVTEDPLRQQLAGMFGFSAPAAEPAFDAVSPPTTGEPDPGAAPRAAGPGESAARPARPHLTRRHAAVAAAIAGALLLVAAIGAFLALPLVTVELSLAQEPVATDLVFTAGWQAAEGDAFSVPVEPVSGSVRIERALPTTGEKAIPDTPASGSVTLANPTAEEIVVPAGTTVTSDAGIAYAFAADVTVPAARDGTPGYATGQVEATEPGTAGNLETGDLSGRLDLGVYYSNREAPIAGGTDRMVQVVSAADIEALRAEVDAEIQQAAARSLEAGLGADRDVLAGSIALAQRDDRFDHAEGEEAATLTVVVTAQASGLAYDAARARAEAAATLESGLAGAVPEGYRLAPSTVTIENPVEVDAGPDGARLRIAASAAAVQTLPDDDEIAADLAGQDQDEASATLLALPGVESAELSYRPGWWPRGMPRLAQAIEIETRP